jgi:ferredoxin-NADP reductase
VKGEGVQFESLRGGKILMLVGGTGIYPLSDLIDMLYKDALAKLRPELFEEIVTITPLLKSRPFAAFSFELIAAFNSLDDVHPITFRQLQFLTVNSQFKLTIKLRDGSSPRVNELKEATYTNDGFEKLLEKREDLSEVAKIWICGPPKMNENVSKHLREY